MESEAARTIERWLLQDGKTFNARILSIECGITHDEATTQMLRFVDGRKNEQPYVIWSLSGSIAKQQEEQDQSQASSSTMDVDGARSHAPISHYCMKLVDESNLEQTKRSFASEPSVRLYALAPPLPAKPSSAHRIAAASQLAVIQHELKNAEKYVKAWQDSNRGVQFGAIRPPADVKLVDGQESGKKGIVDTASEVKARLAPALTAKPIKTEAKKKDEPKPKAQAKVVKDEDEEMLDDGPIGYADTEVDVTPAPTTKGGASSKRADAGDKKATLEEKRRRQKQELMDMMDEDRDGRADPEVRAAKSTSTSMMGGGDAGKSEKDTPVNKSSKVDDRVTTLDAASTPPVKEKQRVRKQRKVVRKEVTKNAKGYRITKDVEGYESYSSFESSEDEQEANSKKGDAPKKKAAANRKAELGGQELSAAQPDPTPVTKEEKANAVPPKKGGSGGQTSGQQKLSSFFKKK